MGGEGGAYGCRRGAHLWGGVGFGLVKGGSSLSGGVLWGWVGGKTSVGGGGHICGAEKRGWVPGLCARVGCGAVFGSYIVITTGPGCCCSCKARIGPLSCHLPATGHLLSLGSCPAALESFCVKKEGRNRPFGAFREPDHFLSIIDIHSNIPRQDSFYRTHISSCTDNSSPCSDKPFPLY